MVQLELLGGALGCGLAGGAAFVVDGRGVGVAADERRDAAAVTAGGRGLVAVIGWTR
jgi:hypothetical protein